MTAARDWASKVRDHTILHRPDGFNIARHPTQHLLGLLPDGLNDFFTIRSTFMADGYNGRFIQYDTLAAYINKGIGRTEVDCHIAGKVTA